MNGFSTFLQLQKVDVAKREVWGVAALEQADRAREIMDYEKSLPNFINWSRDMNKASGGQSLGNVRAMHRDVAAGKVIHFEPRDETKQIYIGTKIVDDNEWKKVLEGVYTGFSVGGSYGEKWPDPVLKGVTRYEAKPVEISLVDVPCMPGAMFEIVKADGASEMRKFVTGETTTTPGAFTSGYVEDLGKGDFEGHPFRGNQYADGGGQPMERTNRGYVVRSPDKSKTVHVRPNKANQNYELSIFDEDGNEYKTYADNIEAAKTKANEAILKPETLKGKNSKWWMVKSLGVAELLKEANMNTSELLSKLAASSDPEMKVLAGELEKAFPPKKEKKDEESDDPEGDKKSKKNPFDSGNEPQEEDGHEEPDGDEGPNPEAESDGDGDESAEAEEQPTAGQPSTEQTEAIRAVVIQLLEELGFVQEQGGQPGAPAAVKFVTAEALQKRLSASDELKKQYDALAERQKELTSDIVKVANSLDEMAKRGGPAPIIRDLGAINPQNAGELQKAAMLRDVIEKTTDPVARQALQAELTRLEIKQVQKS